MARIIEETPVLEGEDARRFLRKMNEKPTERDIEFKNRINKDHNKNFEFL